MTSTNGANHASKTKNSNCKAWTKGYRAVQKGISPWDGLLHGAHEAPDAWLDGYTAGRRNRRRRKD